MTTSALANYGTFTGTTLIPIALSRAVAGQEIVRQMASHRRIKIARRHCEIAFKMYLEQYEWIRTAEDEVSSLLRTSGPKPDLATDEVLKMLDAIRELYFTWDEFSREAANLLLLLQQTGQSIPDMQSFDQAVAYVQQRLAGYENEDFAYRGPELTPAEIAATHAALGI